MEVAGPLGTPLGLAQRIHEPLMVISRLARENPSALLSISTKFGISVNVTNDVADVLGMLLYFKLIAIVMLLY